MQFCFTTSHLKAASCFGFTAFLEDGLLDTTSLGEGNRGSGSTSDDENILQPCGESVSLGILDGNNSKGSFVLFNVHKSTNSSTIVSLGDHDHGANVEFHDIRHFSSVNIDLDSVVDLEIGVRVSEGATIVGDSAWDLVGANKDLIDSAELVLSFSSVKTVKNVTSLNVVHKTEAVV